MVAMGPQDTYVVKMEHLVTRTTVRGELAPPTHNRVCVCSYTETDTLLHVFSVGTQA